MFNKTIARNNDPKKVEKSKVKYAISCDSVELKDFIMDWTKSEENKLKPEEEISSIKSFREVLKSVGIKIPVRLTKLDKTKQSFICTELGECDKPGYIPKTIKLIEATLITHCIIEVIKNNVRKCFEVRGKFINKKITYAIMLERIFAESKDGRKLEIYYRSDAVFIETEIDATHQLSMKIKPVKFRDLDCMIEYLLGLTKTLEVSKVYVAVISFIGNDYDQVNIELRRKILPKDAANLTEFEINLDTRIEPINSICSLIKQNSKEYVTYENGEMTEVKSDGSWVFSNNTVRIINKNGVSSVSFYTNIPRNTDLRAFVDMKVVQEKVKSIMKYVK